MEHTDVVIVGAGVVGLACAAVLARRGLGVVVLERHSGPGRETSSRNSGVIHAGLYYPAGSMKAAACVEGRRRLYARCAAHGVPHRKTGKLVVATDDAELPMLDQLLERAHAAGVESAVLLDATEVKRREPGVRSVGALWSPDSGVVDAHALMDDYRREAEAHGATLVTHTHVVGLERVSGAWRIGTDNDRGERFDVEAQHVVNSAGLHADRIAELAGVDVDAAGWRLHYAKGDYFALGAGAPRPQTALVYPVPEVAGLGIHLTVDLGGRCVAGPDATYVDEIDYDVDANKAAEFAESISRYLPGIGARHLTPDYSGIRPKLAAPGEAFRDFVVAEGSDHGAPGTIHLVGIESPGLTASEALAVRAADLVS